ncbi:MAG: fibronectin type III domain-containing protein, partial [Planctomycetota bacterium]
MCKKLFFLVSLILLLALAGNAMAQLDPASITDGNVYLFENVGTDVPDDSPNGHTANLVGNPQVVDGLKGNALQFNGVDDGVHIPDAATINLSTHQNRTVVAIFQCADVTKPEKQVVYEEGGTTRGLVIYVHEGLVYAGGWNLSDYTPEWEGTFLSAPISSNQWVAVAAVLRDGIAAQEDDKFEMWMDGVFIDKGPGGQWQSRSDDIGIGNVRSQTKFHDGNFTGGGSYFEGMVDELWMINVALTQVELGGFAGKIWPFAFGPKPADGALNMDTWVSMSWTPGGFALSHDVYFGENFDDVDSGAEGTFQGNQATTDFIAGFPGFAVPDGLVPGTTYYWRVDEVNEAEPNSPWKGKVWSFDIPPKTAYFPDPADGAESVDPDGDLSWTPGFGAKLHNV